VTEVAGVVPVFGQEILNPEIGERMRFVKTAVDTASALF
jgi:hypothetical protein